MRALTILAAFAASLISSAQSATPTIMDEAACNAMFTTADANKNSVLDGDEDDDFIEALNTGPRLKGQETIIRSEFMTACQNGQFDSVTIRQ
jgi:hypothetical protein